MKVKKLVEELNKFDSSLDVICSTEDKNLLPPGHSIRVLEIDGLIATDAEKRRGGDGISSVKMGSSGSSKRIVFIHVTADF